MHDCADEASTLGLPTTLFARDWDASRSREIAIKKCRRRSSNIAPLHLVRRHNARLWQTDYWENTPISCSFISVATDYGVTYYDKRFCALHRTVSSRYTRFSNDSRTETGTAMQLPCVYAPVEPLRNYSVVSVDVQLAFPSAFSRGLRLTRHSDDGS